MELDDRMLVLARYGLEAAVAIPKTLTDLLVESPPPDTVTSVENCLS